MRSIKSRGRAPERRSPRILDLVLMNALFGAGAGLLFGLGVLATDGFGLGALVAADAAAGSAVALWLGGTAAGFATFAVTTATLTLPGEGGGRRPTGRPVGALAPVRIRGADGRGHAAK